MQPERRETERAFQAVYMSLIKRNQDLTITESKKAELQLSGRVGVRHSAFHTARVTAANTTLRSLSFNTQNCESIGENCTCSNTTLLPHSEHVASTGCRFVACHQAQDISTKSVIKNINLQIQHTVETSSSSDESSTLATFRRYKRMQHAIATSNSDESSIPASCRCSTDIEKTILHIEHAIATDSTCDYSSKQDSDGCSKDIGKASLRLQHPFPTNCAGDSSAWASNQCSKDNTDRAGIDEVNTLSSYLSDSDESVLSGESHRKKEVCEACQELFCKALENPSASTMETGILDPVHWCCNYWMMSCPVPRKTRSKRKRRDLQTIAKDLAAQSQFHVAKSTTSQEKCCRPHRFLQRNLQSGKKARQNISSTRSKDEKTKEKCSSKQLKRKNAKKYSRDRIKENKKKPYIFKVDRNSPEADNICESCEESESIAELAKRKKVSRVQGMEEDRPPVPMSNTSRLADSVFVSLHSETKDAASVQRNMLSRVKPRKTMGGSLTDTTESFEMEGNPEEPMFSITIENSEEEGSDLDENQGSSPFAWVGGGGFRELLAKMNSRASSSVVREY